MSVEPRESHIFTCSARQTSIPLGAPVSEKSTGLVMIQIDGLGRRQLERALKEGRMPYLRRLQADGSHALHSIYSGLPSCTPAAQAELFYGVKNAVPSFAFRDPRQGKIVKMYSHETATDVQAGLQGRGPSLLEGGASYSNIFNGGALRSSYCACQMGLPEILGNMKSLGILPLLFRHPLRLLGILALMAREAVAAMRDAFRPEIPLDSLGREAVFIMNRIFVSVCLREIITVLAARDIRQGLPVVHVNFMGYDEHAHRRGPASHSAHAHLAKIDKVIARLAVAIGKPGRRPYQCWIYSDHGQEAVQSYQLVAGRTLEAAIQDIGGGIPVVRIPEPHALRLPSQGRKRKAPENAWLVSNPGPLVSLYPNHPMSLAQKEALSQALVGTARIPMVLHSPAKGRVRACTAEGWLDLPEDGAAILGPGHPFPEECIQDLMELCQHSLAGPLIVSGWKAGTPPISFFSESGSHGGMGRDEVHGFILLPTQVAVPARKPYLRFLDIREMAFNLVRPEAVDTRTPSPPSPLSEKLTT